MTTTPSTRRAFVTGAGTGIGRALAKRLATDGWTVAVSARTRADLETLAAELPGHIEVFPLDVSDEAAVMKTVGEIEALIGPLDLAVLNAGIYKPLQASDFSAKTYRAMVEVNLLGTVNCLAALMPKFIARRAGHISVVSSLTGYVGLPSAAAYGATKAALINMCQALYPELRDDGVRLSVVTPGFVDTPATKGNDFEMPFLISTDEAVERIMKGFASDRFEIAFPKRMAFAIKLLASLPHGLRFAITRRMVRR